MKKKLFRTLVCLLLLTGLLAVPAGADYTSHENFVKVTEEDAHAMFNNNETFILMCYDVECGKCIARGKLIEQWMTEYDQTVHGLNVREQQIPYWLRRVLPTQSITPIVALVRSDHSGYAITGILSARAIRDMIEELSGLYTPGTTDFSRLNDQMAADRPTDEETIRRLYLGEPSSWVKGDVDEVYRKGYIRENGAEKPLSAYTEYDKANAINAHVCYTCYFSFPMEEANAGQLYDVTTVASITSRRGNTYALADYARHLYWDAGFPCRMVKGFVMGNGFNKNANAIVELYDQYLADGDIEAFAQGADPLANHYWLEVWVDGEWIIVDPSLGCSNDHYGDRSSIQGVRRGAYFDVTKTDDSHYNAAYVSWPEQGAGLEWFWDIDYEDKLYIHGDVSDTAAAQTAAAWVGMYDEAGRMLDCAAVTLEDGSFDLTLTRRGYADELSQMKLFLLDDDLSPVRMPYTRSK